MTTSSALLMAASSKVTLTKPAVKPEDKEQADKTARARDHKDKDYRSKELKHKDRIKEHEHAEKVSKSDTKAHDFENELETATTLATPIVASVVVTPAADLMASQVNVSLIPAVTTSGVAAEASVTTTTPAVTAVAAAATTASVAADVPEPTTPTTPATAETTTTASGSIEVETSTAEPVTLSSAQMKQVIDALNHTDTVETAGVRVVPSEANKTAIQNALVKDPNLFSKPDALAALVTSLQTKPANGLAKGIDIRLEKTTELNLYAMADASTDAAATELPEAVDAVTIAASHKHTDAPVDAGTASAASSDDGLSVGVNTTTALSTQNTTTTLTTAVATNHAAAANVNTQAANISIPPGAAQAVAAVIDKYVKDEKTGSQSISLRLDPAELGRMDVRMEYKKGDGLKVHLVVEKADTMNMFLRDQRSLEAALSQAGIDSANVSLSFEHNQGAFEHAMNQHGADDGSDHSSAHATARSELMNEMDELVHAHMDMYIDASGLTRCNVTV